MDVRALNMANTDLRQRRNSTVMFKGGAGERLNSIVACEALQSVPPFLRVLLTTDGTVTKSLEAFFWEPISVQPCAQSYELAGSLDTLLAKDCADGEALLFRQVRLVGASSATEYATAESFINTSLVPGDLKSKLDRKELGIGELLIQKGMDTHRELVEIGCLDGGATVWRKYLIRRQGRAFMEINEYFNTALYS